MRTFAYLVLNKQVLSGDFCMALLAKCCNGKLMVVNIDLPLPLKEKLCD
jgi:hypothetical protein